MTLFTLPDVIRHDGLAFCVSVAALLGLVGVGEALREWGRVTPENTRRLVHAGVGIFVACTPFLFQHALLVYVLAVAFVGINYATLRRGWLQGIHGAKRQSLGTVTFPLALIPALFLCWTADPQRVFALQIAFLILALADPLAALVGSRRATAHGTQQLGKTQAGSATFFGTALLVSAGVTAWCVAQGRLDWTRAEVLLASFSVAAVTTAVEALGRRGWDNFFIVPAALVILVAFDEHPDERLLLGVAVLAGGFFGWATYRLRVLDGSGAIAGGLLATSVLGLGGWAWAVPALTFFITSSALSLVGRRRKAAVDAVSEKGHRRDAGQVYANGGIGWGLLLLHIFFPRNMLYLGFLGAFAAAAADTWGTEIGSLSKRLPRLITTGRRVPHGTSGAVSLLGTSGSVAGAVVVALSAWPFLKAVGDGWLLPALVVVMGGVLGAFLDSLIGATVQARYLDPTTGRETERAASPTGWNRHVRGWAWLHNDQVNWLCTMAGALLAMACFRAVDFAF